MEKFKMSYNANTKIKFNKRNISIIARHLCLCSNINPDEPTGSVVESLKRRLTFAEIASSSAENLILLHNALLINLYDYNREPYQMLETFTDEV